MTKTIIAGITIPDSALANDATRLIRDTTNELIFNHSRRVFLFGSLQAAARDITPDPELLYVSALFHDTGLVEPYRTSSQRFELDGADHVRTFLRSHGVADEIADIAWTAIALHTTPGVPDRMHPVIAATTAGVETDVLGLRLENISDVARDEITAAHPRPRFKENILEAFAAGFDYRPDSTFGTVNADVLAHFSRDFHRSDFVEVIRNSSWSE